MHNLSFVEDPSRILRGIKLEQRLNMKFEENTLRLLNGAVHGGLIECLSSSRIRAELELILKESCFRKIILRMQELKLWESLFPGINFTDSLNYKLRMMGHIMKQVQRHEINFNGMSWLVGIAVILSDSRPEIQFSAMDRMSLNPNERKELTLCFTRWPQVEKFCTQKKPPRKSEIFLFFREYNPVQLVYWFTCMKTHEGRRMIIEHMEIFTPLKGELNGADLKYMGLRGKEIGETLNSIKLSRIDGHIKTREEETSFVKSLLVRRAFHR